MPSYIDVTCQRSLSVVVLKINFDFFIFSRRPAAFLRNQWGGFV